MKILHILYDEVGNPWFGGGGAIRNQEIYKRMAKRHEITVLTGAYPHAAKEVMIDGVKYVRLGIGNNVWQSLFSFSFNVFWYRNYERYDLIVKDLLPVCPVYTPFLRTKIPVIASIQNMEYCFLKAYKLAGILPWMNHEVSIRLYKNYLLTAYSMYDLLKRKTTKDAKITVIPYGVEDELFGAVSSERNYILYLGRFDIFQKGLEMLLQAFKIVSTKFHQVELVFAGGGRDEARLRAMVKDLSLTQKVTFVGRVNGEKKRDLLGNCLMVCMPSRFESWGIVAIEAGAVGKPVIGTKIHGLIDSIRDGETGILVPPARPDLLAEKMIYLIENEDERVRLGRNGKLWAKNFNWDTLAKEQERFYCEVVEKAKKS